jgi:hypothetical protein
MNGLELPSKYVRTAECVGATHIADLSVFTRTPDDGIVVLGPHLMNSITNGEAWPGAQGSVTAPPTVQRAEQLLQQMLGADAAFRDGQLDAILSAVDDRARTLVVQRTGWGKSLVYFIAAKILRERGLGPALLVSP